MQLTTFFLETVVPFLSLYATPAGINNFLVSQYTQKAHVDAVKCCRKSKLLDGNNMLNILRHNVCRVEDWVKIWHLALELM